MKLKFFQELGVEIGVNLVSFVKFYIQFKQNLSMLRRNLHSRNYSESNFFLNQLKLFLSLREEM